MKNNRTYIFILFLIIFAHLFLLSKLNFFPYPELFTYPYLTNHGLIPYKQIFDQHFPGFLFFPINFNNMGMVTWQTARLWQYFIVVIIQLEIFFIIKNVFKSVRLAIISCVIYLLLQPLFEGWVLWIDSLLPIFILPAYFLVAKIKQKGILVNCFLSGLVFGFALTFKQVIAPLIIIVFMSLITKKIKLTEMAGFVFGVFIYPLLMLIYIYHLGALKDFWYWTVIYNVTTFAKYGRKYPTYSEIIKVGSIFGFSLLGLFSKKNRSQYVLLGLFILGTLFSAYARFDFVHLQPALPFICIATAITILWFFKNKYFKILLLIYFTGLSIYLLKFYKSNLGNNVYFFDKNTMEIADRLSAETYRGQHIFLYGVSSHLYQITNTLPAGDVFVFQFPWFSRVAEVAILNGIKKDEPKIILADRSVEINHQLLTDFESEINKYILDNYELKDKIGSVEFLIRK